MFRTRDFVLLFCAIMFLVLAIGTTLLSQSRITITTPSDFQLSELPDREFGATIVRDEPLSRAANVTAMREKIADQTFITATPAAPEQASTTNEQDADQAPELITCANYRPYAGFWDARGLVLQEVAGARLLSRATADPMGEPIEVLRLSQTPIKNGNPTCVSSDVIGIANDGSLIRNDEGPVYSIFGSQTIVGYALDGFPIYGGPSNQPVDACNGRGTIAYGYFINPASDAIVNCFAANPVALP